MLSAVRAGRRLPRLRSFHARSGPFLEALESRTLLSLAVAGIAPITYAPSSLVGRAITFTVTRGTGVYPSSGSVIFAVSSVDDTFYYLGLSSSIASSYGNYTYVPSSMSAALFTWDEVFSLQAVNQLQFTSPTNGTFSLSGPSGTEGGTFTVSAAPAGQAPASVAGLSLTFQIADGNGQLADSGSFVVTTGATANTYTLRGASGTANSSGHYTLSNTTAVTAHLAMSDSLAGNLSGELAFATNTTGTFLFSNIDTRSWQLGTFSLSNAPPIGFVDVFSASAIWGWAHDPSSPLSPVTVAVYVDGSPYRYLSANIPRVDLLPALGSSEHAFYFDPSGLAAGFHDVQVFALDTTGGTSVLLASSTLQFGNLPIGAIDLATGTTVSGWCFDPDNPGRPVTLHLYIDNEFVASGIAGASRPDLISHIGSANHGFTFQFPAVAPSIHRYDLYAYDSATAAFHRLVSRTVNTNRLPTGWLDLANAVTLAGWAYDPDLGSGPCPILYQIDDNAPVQTFATTSRSDLTSYLGSSDHAFNIAMPTLTDTPHTLSIWALDATTAELVGLASRTFTGASSVRGWIDLFNASTVAGWAFDSSLLGHASSVRIDVDDVPGTPFTASLSRPDLVPVVGRANLGFFRPLTLTPGMHLVNVMVQDTAASSWMLLGSRFVCAPAFAGPAVDTGWIDAASFSSISGWAFSPALGGASADVRLAIDTIPVRIFPANETRPDLVHILGGTNFGFSLTLPLMSPGTHSITLSILSRHTLLTTFVGQSAVVVPF